VKFLVIVKCAADAALEFVAGGRGNASAVTEALTRYLNSLYGFKSSLERFWITRVLSKVNESAKKSGYIYNRQQGVLKCSKVVFKFF
jgi:hypothetical protein